MLKVGTILHGTYRIDNYLSSGGFGNTYVATNIEFEERVAIKEFFMKGVTQRDDNQITVGVSNAENNNSFLEQKEKFKKEARRIRQLKNEHIVSVHDLFEENGTAYYVMDFVDGENLAEHLKHTAKPMTEQKVRNILPQILDALKSVHDAGIWHLDLKPANIMVDKAGSVKLIDFGASKQLNAQKGGATTSTAISYTNGYAPREQMEQNYDKFGPWTDIYSLGATLYNLLTNKRPPLPTDIDDDMSEDKHLALPFPDGVSDDVKCCVLWMMKTNRLQRPQCVDAIMEAEKAKENEPKKTINQQSTSKSTVEYDDEATVVDQSKTQWVKNPEPEVYSEPKQNSDTHILPNSANRKGSDKVIVIDKIFAFVAYVAVAFVFIIIIILVTFGKGENPVQDENVQLIENTAPQVVERMAWSSPLGNCQYSGPVDESNNPHGKGEAFFNDGRYYKGDFEHGVFSGDDCYFKYANGDEFKGFFRDNSFYYGTYTIAEDESYFDGMYKNGQPDNGTWYNKDGEIIE